MHTSASPWFGEMWLLQLLSRDALTLRIVWLVQTCMVLLLLLLLLSFTFHLVRDFFTTSSLMIDELFNLPTLICHWPKHCRDSHNHSEDLQEAGARCSPPTCHKDKQRPSTSCRVTEKTFPVHAAPVVYNRLQQHRKTPGVFSGTFTWPTLTLSCAIIILDEKLSTFFLVFWIQNTFVKCGLKQEQGSSMEPTQQNWACWSIQKYSNSNSAFKWQTRRLMFELQLSALAPPDLFYRNSTTFGTDVEQLLWRWNVSLAAWSEAGDANCRNPTFHISCHLHFVVVLGGKFISLWFYFAQMSPWCLLLVQLSSIFLCDFSAHFLF